MRTMTALRAHTRGGPDVLRVEQAPVPVPAPDEVLVEVHAAAITFAELGWDETWQRDGRDRTPVIPSHEFSGVVVGRGAAVVAPAVGDEVYGLVRFDRDGAAAEYLAVPAADVAKKPATVSHAEAAALPLPALTVWQGLVDHAELREGERLLVLGGAGGVGSFGVQLGALLGAEVTTTVRGDDADTVKALGARHVAAGDAADPTLAAGGFDVVLDTVGGEPLRAAYALLRRGGRLITLQGPPDKELAEQHGVRADFFIVSPDPNALTRLAELVDEGSLRVLVAATYPLSLGRAAYASGSARPRRPGKTVLLVKDG